jgi:arsenite oxidase small subunit
MSPEDSRRQWFEKGLESGIPILYHGDSRRGGAFASKDDALLGLRRLQRYMGGVMLLSASAGLYLLGTDGSLWILAVSHAVGLVIIVILDVFLGAMNLLGLRRVYLASIAASFLGIALQLGDITTAPQYNMSVGYFASYLFGLAAFDVLLVLQGIVVVLGVLGRSSVRFLASKRRVAKELNYSRRSFVETMVGFAALVGLGVVLASLKLPTASSPPVSSAQVAGPKTAVANTSNLQVDSPVYFEYPSGYPNVLFKRSDGSLAAFSLLCTHVCCETTFESSSSSFYCPCHGSVFDSAGRVVRGPATTPLPSVTLTVDGSGNVYPTAVSGSSPC